MDKRYLFKRQNTWWVKVAVPRTLRSQLGFDLRESLKTKDLKLAKSRRWKVVEKFKNIINDLKVKSHENKKSAGIFSDTNAKGTVSTVPFIYRVDWAN